MDNHLSNAQVLDKIDHINKLCTELDSLNVKNKEIEKSESPCNKESLISNQHFFFLRIQEAIDTFVSLNNYLIFKLNSNLSFEANPSNAGEGSLFRFEQFENFVKLSNSLTVSDIFQHYIFYSSLTLKNICKIKKRNY